MIEDVVENMIGKLFEPTARVVRIGPRNAVDSGWSAELHDPRGPAHTVRLAPVHCWRDITDHAATFCARVTIDPVVREEMRRAGRWFGGMRFARR